ncbi:MAG: TonB-dependent receptor [Acidobacteriota bacterium]
MKIRTLLQNHFVSITVILLLSSAIAFGQEFRGTIAGKVADQNGAIIPNATVVIKNVETNVESTLTTNEDGLYVASFLNPGKYSVSVSGPGFKKSVHEAVNVGVGDRLSIDFQLEIGAGDVQVNVTADTDLVERGSVSTGTAISQKQIEELPLSEGAAYNLALQAPGVAYTGNPLFTGPTSNGNLSAFRSNGVVGSQITLDGSPNLGFDGSVAYTPPSDAVSQFKIQTNSFDAQTGFTAGATVNVAVKSGTNKFHGTASYFDRSKPLTANNFFSNKAGVARPDRHYYRYGGTVNGPIFKDRTFFMAAYEQQYTLVPAPALFSVPTAKMRTGDFSELLASGILIYDPATAFRGTSTCAPSATGTTICRTPFAGNIIPLSRINQGALNYLKAYPLPNQPGLTNNFFSNNTNILPYKTWLARIDHNINANQKIFGKAFWSTQTDDKFNFLLAPDAFTRGYEYRTNKGGNVVYTATISNSMVFDVRANYNNFVQQRVPANPKSAADFGLTGIASITDSTMAPRLRFTNYETLGPQRSDYNQGLTRGFNEFSVQPSLTQIWGNHTLHYGYDYRRLYETRTTNGNNAGDFTTTGTYTTQASTGTLINNATVTGPAAVGRDLASFLLGIPTSGTLDKGVSYNVYSDYQGFFIQDDWRIGQKWTLNLGVRYELETGVRERNGKLVVGFDPTVPNALGPQALANYNASVPSGVPITAFQNLSGGLIFADSARRPQQTADTNNIQPRIGISYSLGDKTVLRAGFGIFTAPFQLSGITSSLVQTGYTPSTTFQASADNGLTFVGTLNNPFPTGLNPATGSSLGTVTSVGTSLGTLNSITGPTLSVLPHDRKNANSMRTVIGFQRELPFQIGFDASVVYSHSYNLPVFRQLNYIPTQYLSNLKGITDPNVVSGAISTSSTFLLATVPNPFRNTVPTNSTWNGANLARYRLLTAFPEFQDLVTTEYNGTAEYASLQLQATKRYSRGLTMNASYTFSYDHERTRRLNPQDANLTDMIAVASRPHRVTFSSIYELPIGRNRAIGTNWNRLVDGIFGGWQFQAIYEWQSGEPLILPNAFYSGDPTKLVDNLGKKDSQGRKYGIDIPAFDTSGFVMSNGAVPTFGNNYQTSQNVTLRYLPYTMNNFRNQYFQKFDTGLTKNFRITEGMKLQIRVEAINAFNWVAFSGLNLVPSTGATSTFGFATTQRNLPRDIQLGARFTF